jgi:hypothetical protein
LVAIVFTGFENDDSLKLKKSRKCRLAGANTNSTVKV